MQAPRGLRGRTLQHEQTKRPMQFTTFLLNTNFSSYRVYNMIVSWHKSKHII
jgi:hypothetical protein